MPVRTLEEALRIALPDTLAAAPGGMTGTTGSESAVASPPPAPSA
jgi:hypothetical protein